MTSNSILPGLSAKRLVDEFGHDYVRLDFERTDGRAAGVLVDEMSILSKPSDLRARLANSGYDLPLTTANIGEEIRKRIPKGITAMVTRTGWNARIPHLSFALPHKVLGAGGHDVFLLPAMRDRCLASGTSGKLKDWQKEVAMRALWSPVASLLVMAAFAPPLLRFSEVPESFILNVAGNSSGGKTTANMAAASVWGDPTRRRTWAATDRGLAEMAAANNGLLLVLDDAEQAATTPKLRLQRVHDLTHLLTSGQSKEVSSVATQLPKLSFECIVLSSSPQTIEASTVASGDRTDGDRTRLLEIQVPSGEEGGIFANPLFGNAPSDTRTLVEGLASSSLRYYGKAGRRWIKFLVSRQRTISARLTALADEFSLAAAPGATGVEARILRKFGLVYAAGMLAREAKILPWTASQIERVANRGFRDAMMVAFGKVFDADAAVVHLREVLRSPRLKRTTKPLAKLNSANREGYVSHSTVYVKLDKFTQILGEGQSDAPPSKLDVDRLLGRLRDCGALDVPPGNGWTRDVRVASGTHTKWLVLPIKQLSAEISRTANRLAKVDSI